jgi:nitrogen regulatory protein PII-like uncharacterized protein
MTGKKILEHYTQYYKNVYARSLAFSSKEEADKAKRRDAIAASIDRLVLIGYISDEESMKFFKLLHSSDAENWTIVESIIENLNTHDIQTWTEQDSI